MMVIVGDGHVLRMLLLEAVKKKEMKNSHSYNNMKKKKMAMEMVIAGTFVAVEFVDYK